jgi:multicomponent Na+:H+ antiporter subunit E
MKKNYTPEILLGLLLFLFWMVFTASLSPLNIGLGATCSLAVSVITIHLFGRDAYTGVTPTVLIRFPLFTAGIIWEIIKANIDVAGIILDPRLPIDPRVFEYKTQLQGNFPRTLFAASINLTPGTVVLDIKDDIFAIHALAARHESGLETGDMERAVARLFGQAIPDTKTEGVTAS